MKYELKIILDSKQVSVQATPGLYQGERLWSIEYNDKNYILRNVNGQWLQGLDDDLTQAEINLIGDSLGMVDINLN